MDVAIEPNLALIHEKTAHKGRLFDLYGGEGGIDAAASSAQTTSSGLSNQPLTPWVQFKHF